MNPLNHLQIPEFHEFITTPSNQMCQRIDSTRLMVEILGGLKPAGTEFTESSYATKLFLDGNFALVIRYKRERDNIFHPTCTIGYDMDNTGAISINHIQGSKDKHTAFRFHSSFKTTAYFLKLFEESFFKKGIPVYMKDFPEGIENGSYGSRAIERCRTFQSALVGLNRKYFGETKNITI